MDTLLRAMFFLSGFGLILTAIVPRWSDEARYKAGTFFLIVALAAWLAST